MIEHETLIVEYSFKDKELCSKSFDREHIAGWVDRTPNITDTDTPIRTLLFWLVLDKVNKLLSVAFKTVNDGREVLANVFTNYFGALTDRFTGIDNGRFRHVIYFTNFVGHRMADLFAILLNIVHRSFCYL
jgi:hypothetical protein